MHRFNRYHRFNMLIICKVLSIETPLSYWFGVNTKINVIVELFHVVSKMQRSIMVYRRAEICLSLQHQNDFNQQSWKLGLILLNFRTFESWLETCFWVSSTYASNCGCDIYSMFYCNWMYIAYRNVYYWGFTVYLQEMNFSLIWRDSMFAVAVFFLCSNLALRNSKTIIFASSEDASQSRY